MCLMSRIRTDLVSSTVREALQFSALLRQPRTTSREDKLAYVDVIIDLLEMDDIKDCLVGTAGENGLSVEQRKRLTIGVELVAKPSILIFLDEPTSGLDGQAAFNIVRFLKKLAAVGQAVLVTIHQPSAQLFYEFDTLLLLARGGNMVYFGDIGDHASTVKAYFARHNAECPPEKNPAEHMIDVVSDRHRNWHQIWLDSPEYTSMTKEIDRMVDEAAAAEPHTVDDGAEFAMPLWDQTKIVSMRLIKAMYRNIGYVDNKLMLHVIIGLFTGFTFWKIGNGVDDLRKRMFALFNFIFVAPGVIGKDLSTFYPRASLTVMQPNYSPSLSRSATFMMRVRRSPECTAGKLLSPASSSPNCLTLSFVPCCTTCASITQSAFPEIRTKLGLSSS